MLIFHIVIAFAGIIATAIAYAHPSQFKVYSATVLAGITFITGFSLLVSYPSHLAQSCVVGLIYFGLVGFGIISAKGRIANSKI